MAQGHLDTMNAAVAEAKTESTRTEIERAEITAALDSVRREERELLANIRHDLKFETPADHNRRTRCISQRRVRRLHPTASNRRTDAGTALQRHSVHHPDERPGATLQPRPLGR